MFNILICFGKLKLNGEENSVKQISGSFMYRYERCNRTTLYHGYILKIDRALGALNGTLLHVSLGAYHTVGSFT